MAYLHCHSCDWSQDDFWSWRYNPLTKTWRDIKWNWKPVWRSMDKWYLDDIKEYLGISYLYRKKESPCTRPIRAPTTFEYQVFSWYWFIIQIVMEFRNILRMRWWTWKSWQRNKNTAVCPGCGNRNFDID